MRLKKAVIVLSFGSMFLLTSLIDFKAGISEYEVIPNFSYFEDTEQRKLHFFEFMRPIVQEENARVLKQRTRFLKLYEKHQRGEHISFWDRQWLQRYSKEYQIDAPGALDDVGWELLKRRIDFIPTELVLAQSANESAWGTSRFAINGNAMFGQLTFSQTESGMVPYRRKPDAVHTVVRYDSVRQSIRSYLNNLNTHPAYRMLRDIRQRFREKGLIPDGYALAAGLVKYSERREDYVEEIRQIITANRHLMNVTDL